MRAYLNALTAQLNSERIRREAAMQAQAEKAAATAREKLIPLDDRLSNLLASIPLEVQREGLPITALQAQLRARGRGHSRCHVGELGDALRRLGFSRERRWSGGGGFRALWFPERR